MPHCTGLNNHVYINIHYNSSVKTTWCYIMSERHVVELCIFIFKNTLIFRIHILYLSHCHLNAYAVLFQQSIKFLNRHTKLGFGWYSFILEEYTSQICLYISTWCSLTDKKVWNGSNKWKSLFTDSDEMWELHRDCQKQITDGLLGTCKWIIHKLARVHIWNMCMPWNYFSCFPRLEWQENELWAS